MGDARDIWQKVRALREKANQKRADRNMAQLQAAIVADPRISMFDTRHGYIIAFNNKRRILYWPQTGAATPRYGKDRSTRHLSGNQLVALITSK